MGTLIQDAAEVATIAGQIDTAITTKGGTLVGGGKLRNAVAGIATIPTGTVDTRFKNLIENTLTTIDDSTITYLSQQSFNTRTSLTSIKLNGVTSTSNIQVFWNCTNVTNLELRNLSMSGSYANMFYGMIGMITLYVKSLKNVTTVLMNMVGAGRPYALTDIYVSDDTAAELVANSNLPFLSNTNTDRYPLITFHCSDNDIKYIDGAWVEVEGSAT